MTPILAHLDAIESRLAWLASRDCRLCRHDVRVELHAVLGMVNAARVEAGRAPMAWVPLLVPDVDVDRPWRVTGAMGGAI